MEKPSIVTPFQKDSVRGFLHESVDPAGPSLILTHGAGGNCQAPSMVAVGNAFQQAGFRVLRCDLPFRQRKRFGPPAPAAAAESRAGLKDAVAEMRALGSARVFLGGHSYGGRQASILAGEEPELIAALLLLSYPLHPPNKPGQLRTGHFSTLAIPTLFIHGTRDPFGSIEEMRVAVDLIPAKTKLVVIENAGHDLARGAFDVQERVVSEFLALAEVH